MKTPLFRKKCEKCGRVSLYPIHQTTCGVTRRLGHTPCTGTVQPYSADFDDAVLNLVAAAKQVRDNGKPILLDYAIEDLETWDGERKRNTRINGMGGKGWQTMRQIDHMNEGELETLRLKGMLKPYESTEDFKMRLRMMLPHNKGMSILGAPRPHPNVVRPRSTDTNGNNDNETPHQHH
jgi:hypothetical protein